MEKNKKKKIVIVALIVLIGIVGISYAFFVYNRTSNRNQHLIAGQIYLKLLDDTDSISLNNIFPQTVEEARSNKDNVLEFSISGINTTENKNIYYEIKLNEGEDINGKKRFNPEDLRFDLVEIIDGNRNTVVDNMSFADLNDRRIWVNMVEHGNNSEVNIKYELRMWLSEDVIISDTDPKATYPASDYNNYYANAMISVYGDLDEKNSTMNHFIGNPIMDEETQDIMFWPAAINEQKANITEVHFASMDKEEMDRRYSNATIKADVTDTTKNNEGSVLTWLEADSSDNSKYIMYVVSDGITFFPEDSSCMFGMFTSLTSIEFSNINTRNVTNMMAMFGYCTSLTELNLSSFDTSNVISMNTMFGICTSLTELDLSNFNMNKVEDIYGMFGLCSSLTTLNISNWDLMSVSSYDDLFMDCTNLTNINMSNWQNIAYLQFNPLDLTNDLSNLNLDLSDWDMKMALMLTSYFQDHTNIVSLDLSNWNTKYIVDMSQLFYGCTNLVSLNLSGWDTSNVTNMAGMFTMCESLKELDLSSFNTKNVIDMQGMFGACYSLTSLDLSSFDTKNVNNMMAMFYECTSLKKLDISNFVFNDVIRDISRTEQIDFLFTNIPDDCLVTVKSKSEQSWILSEGFRPDAWTEQNVVVKEY